MKTDLATGGDLEFVLNLFFGILDLLVPQSEYERDKISKLLSSL
jgi:hypothetical protein